MPCLSLEGRGCFETQGLRCYQTGPNSGTHERQQAQREYYSSIDSSRQIYTRALAGRGRQQQRRQTARRSSVGYPNCTRSTKRRAGFWPSSLASGRSSKFRQNIEARISALCLRTLEHVTPVSQGQKCSIQRGSKPQLLRLLIVVRAAQIQSSSRDATCRQQLEVSVANKDADHAHSAFMELQRAGQSARPTAQICNGLLQRKLPRLIKQWEAFGDGC